MAKVQFEIQSFLTCFCRFLYPNFLFQLSLLLFQFTRFSRSEKHQPKVSKIFCFKNCSGELKNLENSWRSATNLQIFFLYDQSNVFSQQVRTIFETKYQFLIKSRGNNRPQKKIQRIRNILMRFQYCAQSYQSQVLKKLNRILCFRHYQVNTEDFFNFVVCKYASVVGLFS